MASATVGVLHPEQAPVAANIAYVTSQCHWNTARPGCASS
jgi:hypothetical protein